MVISQHQHLIFLFYLLIIVLLIITFFISSYLRLSCFMILFFLFGMILDLNTHHDSQLLALATHRERITLEGTVLSPAKITEEMASFELKSHRVFIGGKVMTVMEKIRVTIFKHPKYFLPGEKIRFPARLRPFRNFNNPGRYNYELAMNLRGLSCTASVSDGRRIVPMGRGTLGFPEEMLEEIRRPVRNFFHNALSPQNQALFCALILGERQGISHEVREHYNIAGLGHILAVSGLHIGLVAWLAFLLTKCLLSFSYRITLMTDIRRIAALVTCLPVVAYACLTGFQISSQRAMVMALAYLFSMILGREKEVWSTFSLAAFIVLAINPHSLFSISFHLSFGAVIGILWLAPVIYKKIPAPGKDLVTIHGPRVMSIRQDLLLVTQRLSLRLYGYLTGLVSVTLSAIIFLLPIISFYFHRISLVSIPANLIAVPILGLWIIPLGLLTVITLPISPSLANVFLQAGAFGLEGMMGIIQFWSHFSWAALWVITPNIFEILLFYGMIFFIFFQNHRPWARIGLLLVLLLLSIDVTYWIYKTQFNRYLKVTYLDVGQGNSALIQFPGSQRMLIDGGGFARDHFDVGRMVVAPFLWHSKITRIDYLVLSHPQADHMNGLCFIASHFRPREFWYNGDIVESQSFKKLMEILASKKITKLFPADLRSGREFSGVKVELLHPLSGSQGTMHLNHGMDLNNSGAGRSKKFSRPDLNTLSKRSSWKIRTFAFPECRI
ncbi:MAG: ComEC/Rec2 family competence protein [Thermodesulfobacteriota bacterium]|nr:ComEC/Rec2 family competence protein [Thermodesulfobacteriota bacterium]